MSAELLSTIAGAILSLLFSYVPGLSGWYQKLGENGDGVDGGTARRLFMLGLLVLTAAGAYGLACSGWGSAGNAGARAGELGNQCQGHGHIPGGSRLRG